MSETNLKPFIESAILTLEQLLEHRQALSEIDPYGRPEDEKFYAYHNQILYPKAGLCSTIRTNQSNNLDLQYPVLQFAESLPYRLCSRQVRSFPFQ